MKLFGITLGRDTDAVSEDVLFAAAQYYEASQAARGADRVKRASRKVLDRVPAGRYGGWLIERVPTGRESADLETIRKIFAAHGLGAVPMKGTAPSLKVTKL